MFIDLLREIGTAISDKPKNIVKLIGAQFLNAATVLSKLAYPYLFLLTIEAISTDSIPQSQALGLAAGFTLIWTTGKVIPHFRNMLLHATGAKMSHNLMNKVIRKFYALPLEYKITKSSAPAIQHFNAAYGNIGQTFVTTLLGETITSGLEIVTAIILLGAFYGYPALFLTGAFAVNVTYSVITSGMIHNTQTQHTISTFRTYKTLIGALGQYENAHYFGQVDYERNRLLEIMSQLSSAQTIALNTRSVVTSFANLITGATLMGTTLYIAYLTNSSVWEVNDFVWVSFYILITAESQAAFSGSLVRLRGIMSPYKSLLEYLDQEEVEKVQVLEDFMEAEELLHEDLVINEESQLIPANQKGEADQKQADFMRKLLLENGHEPTIEFDNVSFGYEDADEMVFENLSFTIPANKLTIIAGLSGEGKSSIMKLILGFYKPTSGTIYVAGQNISAINIDDVRSRIAIVPQIPTLFNDTLRKNLLYSNMVADEELINGAIELAGLTELVKDKTLDFMVGGNGDKLSGGQKQRVALARAIMKADTDFLVLDEPTSSLDIDTETKVLNNLRKLLNKHPMTTLFITHKLTSLAQLGKVDNVIVIKKGQQPEEGTIGELMQKKGLFFQQISIAKKQVDETFATVKKNKEDIEDEETIDIVDNSNNGPEFM